MGRHVLKNNEVQFAGSLQLHMETAGAAKPAQPQHDVNPACARIAEMNTEFALIEVTCSCGQVTFVRCEYAEDEALALSAPVEGQEVGA